MLLPDPELTLADRYNRVDGEVLLTGIQALTRVVMDQIRADRVRGWKTAALSPATRVRRSEGSTAR